MIFYPNNVYVPEASNCLSRPLSCESSYVQPPNRAVTTKTATIDRLCEVCRRTPCDVGFILEDVIDLDLAVLALASVFQSYDSFSRYLPKKARGSSAGNEPAAERVDLSQHR